MTTPKRPLIKYPGAKFKMAKLILPLIPLDHDSYTECFAGTASVLMAKSRSRMETINDTNKDLVNLIQVVRQHTKLLEVAIKLTLWCEDEWRLSFKPSDDPIERARRFYVRCWMSRRPFSNSPGFRRQYIVSRGKSGNHSPMVPAAKSFMNTAYLWEIADRLRGVAVESWDYKLFLSKYDNTRAVHLVDSPYLRSTRANTSSQAYESELWTEEGHRDMADVLHRLDGAVLLCGYQHPLYAELYEENGWERKDFDVRVDGDQTAVESIWLSPTASRLLGAQSTVTTMAMPLFMEKTQ